MILVIQFISQDNALVQYRDVPAKRMTMLVSASQNKLFLLGSVRDSLTKSCSLLHLFLDSKQTIYFFIISSVRRLCSLLSYKLIYVNNIHILRVQTGRPSSLLCFSGFSQTTSCSPCCRVKEHYNLRSCFCWKLISSILN